MRHQILHSVLILLLRCGSILSDLACQVSQQQGESKMQRSEGIMSRLKESAPAQQHVVRTHVNVEGGRDSRCGRFCPLVLGRLGDLMRDDRNDNTDSTAVHS